MNTELVESTLRDLAHIMRRASRDVRGLYVTLAEEAARTFERAVAQGGLTPDDWKNLAKDYERRAGVLTARTLHDAEARVVQSGFKLAAMFIAAAL